MKNIFLHYGFSNLYFAFVVALGQCNGVLYFQGFDIPKTECRHEISDSEYFKRFFMAHCFTKPHC